MVRRGLLLIAILGLAACGRGERGAEGTPGVGAVGKTGDSPYVQTCLEMVAAENWSEAQRLCSMALEAEPNNDAVQGALKTATANLATEPDPYAGGAAPSGEAAGEVTDNPAEEAPPN